MDSSHGMCAADGDRQMPEKLLETRQLTNGTTLSLYDASRRQAADRWIVVLEARVAIPLDENRFPPEGIDGLFLATVTKLLGPEVVYISRQRRVFVPDEARADLIERLRENFYRTTEPYIALPAFPPRYIVQQYRQQLQQQSWREAADGNRR
jgi:hypothetical protein